MMRKIDRTGGAFSRRSPEKVLRRLTGVAVVLMALCLVLSAPAVAEDNVFINVLTAPEVLVQGTSADFVINAEAADAGIQWYIFGPNVFEYGAVTKADEGTSTQFTVALSEGTTTGMAAGQYFAVYQHPMFDQEFQIAADGTNIELDGNKIFNVEDYQAADAAQALCNALDTQTIDDLYVMYSFSVVEQAESTSHTCSYDSITDWQELTSIYSLTSSGNYYLTDDIEVSSTIYVYGTVNLCLNGHTISLADGQTGSVINIGSNAVLNLYDCVGTGKITGGNGQYHGAISGSTFNMYGGAIADNMCPGVYSGTFNMYGGTIMNNTAESGGGVYTSSDGTFNMYGGTIMNNTAESGGGVYTSSRGMFNMYGGTISDNCASSYDGGGGVYTSSEGMFNMSGGTICNNSATYHGGGVAIDYQAVFIMNDGEISNNTAGSEGGGVSTGSWVENSFVMYDGLITNNTAGSSGGGVSAPHDSFWMYGGEISNNTAGRHGGGVTGDITMFGGLITYNSAESGGGFAGGGNMHGGSITNNVASSSVAGLLIERDFNLTGGTISNNGRYRFEVGLTDHAISSSTHFNMSGGLISSETGSGIHVAYDCILLVSNGSILAGTAEWSTDSVAVNVATGDYPGSFIASGGNYSTEIDEAYIAAGYACYEERGLYVVRPVGYTPLPDEPTPTPEPTPVEEIIVRSAADLADTLNAEVSDNVVTLTQDVTIANPIRIYLNAGEEIILTTAGDYSLYRGVADNSLITVQRGTLTLKGKDSANQLTIDGRKDVYTENTQSLIYVYRDGCLILSDDAILTNNAAESGAGVSVGSNGHFEMRGGEISNNYARFGGAGVDVDGEFADYDSEGQVTSVEYGYFNMSGGRICNNDGDGLFNYGITTISGGEISNNTDGISSGGGELGMTGGTIRNNTYNGVSLFDGGIGQYVDGDIVYRDTTGKLFISGDMVIPASERVRIGKNSTIIVTGPLSENAGVYNIQTTKESGVIVNATEAKITGEDLLSQFVLNKSGYALSADGYTLVLSATGTTPTPTPEKPVAPTLTPPESLPEDATVTTNTVAETNAATKAEVGYQVNPADVTTMKAPTITRGKLSVQLNEGVKVVKTLFDGKTVEVEATVNEDGSINLPSGALDDAAAVTVNFIGRQFGDVTNDGKPDTLDAARVLQASVGLFDFSGADTFYGDVSGDGFANTLDAARILQYSVSLVDENYVTKA